LEFAVAVQERERTGLLQWQETFFRKLLACIHGAGRNACCDLQKSGHWGSLLGALLRGFLRTKGGRG